jgi:hypothetical protein
MKDDDCRRHAKECERLSKVATDLKTKRRFLTLSQAWLALEAELPDESATVQGVPHPDTEGR